MEPKKRKEKKCIFTNYAVESEFIPEKQRKIFPTYLKRSVMYVKRWAHKIIARSFSEMLFEKKSLPIIKVILFPMRGKTHN